MKIKPRIPQLILAAAIGTLMLGSGATHALFEQGPKACENEVADRFDGLVMADITASRAYDKRHGEAMVDWKVQTESLSASGTCKINQDGTVLRLKIEHEKHYNNDSSSDTDGFYYDRRSGHWRESDTDEICHSCTAENGFPRRGN